MVKAKNKTKFKIKEIFSEKINLLSPLVVFKFYLVFKIIFKDYIIAYSAKATK